jgi:hypothetical protein
MIDPKDFKHDWEYWESMYICAQKERDAILAGNEQLRQGCAVICADRDALRATEDVIIRTVQRYQPGGSPPPGGIAELTLYVLQSQAKEIKQLREAQHWIPVSERLPEPGALVVGWHAHAKEPVVYRFVVDKEYPAPGHFVEGDCCFCEDVTHWMRIEPPEDNA